MAHEAQEPTHLAITGRKVVRQSGHGWKQTAENLIHDLEIHAANDFVVRFGVVEVSGLFHVRPMNERETERGVYQSIDSHFHTRVTVYQPIHPSVTAEDVDGAVWAYDDGTYWHFSHESPAMRHEAEAYAQAKLIAHFQPRINKQGAVVHAAPDITERTKRHNVLLALNEFVDDSLDEIEKQIRVLPLGHFARNTPHADNHRALVVSAIRAVLAAWKETAKTDTAARHNVERIEGAVNSLTTALTSAPKILTRAEDREASKPKAARQIGSVMLVANGSPTGINLKNKFTARDSLRYTALSSDENVATVAINRGMLTVTPVNAGSATITVRATAPDERFATQTFTVTVVAQ